MRKIVRFDVILLIVSLLLVVSSGFSVASIQPLQNGEGKVSINQSVGYEPLQDQISVEYFHQDEVIEGKNLFGLRRQDVGQPGFTHSDVLVTDMNGTIEQSLSRDGANRYDDPEMINSTTVFLRDDNPLFWNLETGDIEYFNFSSGGHDMEYNPVTDTFLLKEWKDVEYGNETVRYNDLYEKDREGNTLWYWNSTEHFPYNPELADGEYQRGRLVWMHANSVFWDFENGKIYLGSRGLDTFYQIDKETGNVDWGLGKLGNFTLYDDQGDQVDSLFYHPHAVEKISENRFILYDNDYINTTSDDPYTGISNMLEIEVDFTTMEAREVWRWKAPESYFGAPWGDADKLPGGNNLGAFGHISHDVHLTEVNPDGDVVWEMNITQSDEFLWGMYRAERFYSNPLITNLDVSETTLTMEVYDTVKLRHHRNASIEVYENGELLDTIGFKFKPHFQATTVEKFLGSVDASYNYTIVLTNADGITSTLSLIEDNSENDPIPILGIAGTMFAIIIPVILVRRRKS